MKRKAMVGLLLAMILGVTTAGGQESPAPSPTQGMATNDLAVTMKALENSARSVGRLTWSYEYDGKERKTISEAVISVVADPNNCSLKVAWNTQNGTETASFYLEEVLGVYTISSDDLDKGHFPAAPISFAVFPKSQPIIYHVLVAAWTPWAQDFKFISKESAEQFATLLRKSVDQCSATPVTQRLATDGAPSLADTLNFIGDKLTAEGQVDIRWTADSQFDDGTDSPWNVKTSVNYFRITPNPTACVMSFDSVNGQEPLSGAKLSVRRIGKIELLSLKDYLPRSLTGRKWKAFRVKDASPVSVLDISYSGVTSKQLYFSDETLADRVAKAINHAAELCGAGSKPEPF